MLKILTAGLMTTIASSLHAQAVRGVVSDGAAPVPGVVVMLVDASSKEVARAFTNERGEYRLTAPRAGDYRIRTLRIGYRPQLSDPVTLNAGDPIDRPLTIASVPTGLDTVRATGRAACRLTNVDSAQATWRIWEQVRAALAVTQLTRGSGGVSATTVSFTKTLEPIRRRLVSQEFDVRSEFVSQAWRTATPAELHRAGYIITDRSGGMTYQAPSIEALLADEFLEDHCLRIVTTRDPRIIGVAFEPNRDRRDIPEIRGTVWIQRVESRLRSLEYRYENTDKDSEGFGGGEIEFVQMKNGAWAISSWNIRMPMLGYGNAARPGDVPIVDGIRVVGGDLVLVTAIDGQNRDTLWARSPLTLSGVIADSSGAPLRGASIELAGTPLRASTDNQGRFTLVNMLPGIYTMKVRVGGDTTPILQSPIKFADTTATVQVRVPRRAVVASSASVMQSQARGLASLSGTVVDSVGRAIADAEIALPEFDLSTRSDERGEFTLTGIPSGTHQVVARRLGYGALATNIEFRDRETVDRRIALMRLTILDSIVSSAKLDKDPMLLAFNEHKKRGFGSFLDRAQLDRYESEKITSVVQQLSGLRVLRGRGSAQWLMAHRAPNTQCRVNPFARDKPLNPNDPNGNKPTDFECIRREGLLYVPDPAEAQMGMLTACYSEVWMDRSQLNRGRPTYPFDINMIEVKEIEALEWYPSASGVPPEYQTNTTSQCGVLILHSRRFKKK